MDQSVVLFSNGMAFLESHSGCLGFLVKELFRCLIQISIGKQEITGVAVKLCSHGSEVLPFAQC